MNWKKLGLIFNTREVIPGYHYAAVPIAMHIHDSVFRIFFSARDDKSRSHPFSVLFDLEKHAICDVIKAPLLDLGELGTFDEDGVMPTAIVKNGDSLFMYYIGWNKGTSVPFRNSIGLAVSNDNGQSFRKSFRAPILDRSIFDPIFVASCEVLKIQGVWVMYYLSGIKWEVVDGRKTHFYNIKIAKSADLVNWLREGETAIDFASEFEYAISVPRVILDNGLYKMWYSYRGSEKIETYRIGYAESVDGFKWIRKDDQVGIDVSQTGWDSEMICYPYVFDFQERRYMLYNGNSYGEEGFGLAVLENN